MAQISNDDDVYELKNDVIVLLRKAIALDSFSDHEKHLLHSLISVIDGSDGVYVNAHCNHIECLDFHAWHLALVTPEDVGR